MSHRFLIRAALMVGILILAVEGFYLYRFYTNPAPGASDARVNNTERTAPAESDSTTPRTTLSKQENKAAYLDEVGDIQSRSVEALLESSKKLRNYDALNARDVEELAGSAAELEDRVDQTRRLEPPNKYGDQYEAFSSGIVEIRDAVELAYRMAADPVTATQSDFVAYEDHAIRAARYLRQSNKSLNRDYPVPEITEVAVASGL